MRFVLALEVEDVPHMPSAYEMAKILKVIEEVFGEREKTYDIALMDHLEYGAPPEDDE